MDDATFNLLLGAFLSEPWQGPMAWDDVPGPYRDNLLARLTGYFDEARDAGEAMGLPLDPRITGIHFTFRGRIRPVMIPNGIPQGER